MSYRTVLVEELRSGMMLYDWTDRSRERQGMWGALQQGPTGVWYGMVMTNDIQDPREVDGFGYPAVHRVDAFFWNKEGALHFDSFHWTAGTNVRIIE